MKTKALEKVFAIGIRGSGLTVTETAEDARLPNGARELTPPEELWVASCAIALAGIPDPAALMVAVREVVRLVSEVSANDIFRAYQPNNDCHCLECTTLRLRHAALRRLGEVCGG